MIMVLPLRVLSQDAEASGRMPGAGRHSLSLAIGHAQTFEGRDKNNEPKALALPCWSLDYNYRFHPKWAIGLHTDFILEKFTIEAPGETAVAERSYPVAPAVVGIYSMSERWKFQFGTGAEFAKESHVFLIRTGVEYGVELPKEWEVFGSLCYDIKWDTYRTLAISMGITKRLKRW